MSVMTDDLIDIIESASYTASASSARRFSLHQLPVYLYLYFSEWYPDRAPEADPTPRFCPSTTLGRVHRFHGSVWRSARRGQAVFPPNTVRPPPHAI